MSRAGFLKGVRQFHLYLGVFITPALLFFALTGALQTFGLHETSRDNPSYKPARWVVVLAQLHKKQTVVLPERRPAPAAAVSGKVPGAPAQAAPATAPGAAAAPVPAVRKHNLWPMKIFFVLVCWGLLISTATGLAMAYTYNRSKPKVTLALIAGVVVPPLLLLF